MRETVTVQKLNAAGVVTVTWAGEVLERDATSVRLAATFTRGPMALGYVTLKPGDHFIEQFFSDKWYNVFAIYDGDDGAFKGWYCNLTRPAEIGPNPEGAGLRVRAVDLALDYFRQPGGAEFVLDEDEFAALTLTDADRATCREALTELQALAAGARGPFAPEKRAPA
jgi:predicted RNA-binding protein associated with RNAse of E/G family